MVQKLFNSDFENALRTFIEEQVLRVMKTILSSLLEEINKPDYMHWGRYLTPEQAWLYCGYSSEKGLKSMCRNKYTPRKINSKNVRYDREALDAIMAENPIDNYIKQLR